MYKIMSLHAGKEFQLSANLNVKAFPTIHPVQSQVMPQSLLSDPQTCNSVDAYSHLAAACRVMWCIHRSESCVLSWLVYHRKRLGIAEWLERYAGNL